MKLYFGVAMFILSLAAFGQENGKIYWQDKTDSEKRIFTESFVSGLLSEYYQEKDAGEKILNEKNPQDKWFTFSEADQRYLFKHNKRLFTLVFSKLSLNEIVEKIDSYFILHESSKEGIYDIFSKIIDGWYKDNIVTINTAFKN